MHMRVVWGAYASLCAPREPPHSPHHAPPVARTHYLCPMPVPVRTRTDYGIGCKIYGKHKSLSERKKHWPCPRPLAS